MEKDKQKSITIGITGHRNLSAEQCSKLEPAIKKSIENILFYTGYQDGSDIQLSFISPIATGADTLFANIALAHCKGALHICLPFEIDEYRKDFKPGEQITAFNKLIDDPNVEVVTINRLSEGDRDNLYLKVGQKVVDDSDYIIAIWDENKAAGTGGTGDIVEYAVANKKNLLVINPNERKTIIKANYLPHLSECVNNIPRPDKFSDNIVDDYFHLYDHLAIDNQKKYKKIWRTCFSLGWAAALILSVKVSFRLSENLQFMLTIIEIILLSRVAFLIIREKRKFFHQNYLLFRFIAERLRVNNLLYECGFYPIKTVTRVIHKALQEIESKYPVDMINKIMRLTTYDAETFEEKKKRVKSFTNGQATYHKNREERLEKENKQNHHIKMSCLVGFALVVVFHVLHEFSPDAISTAKWREIFSSPGEVSSFIDQISFFLYLFIPTTLARFEAVKYLNDWERLITQSGYMKDFFREISGKIDKIRDENELKDLLTDLNDNIYLENLDWEMFMVSKNEEIT